MVQDVVFGFRGLRQGQCRQEQGNQRAETGSPSSSRRTIRRSLLESLISWSTFR